MAPAVFDQDPRSDEEVEYEPVTPIESEFDTSSEHSDVSTANAAA
jgi:hypothetical protein